MKRRHPIFLKYRREWLHRVTGYSMGYLSRVANHKVPLSRPFVEQCCFKLGRKPKELFAKGAGFPGKGKSFSSSFRAAFHPLREERI